MESKTVKVADEVKESVVEKDTLKKFYAVKKSERYECFDAGDRVKVVKGDGDVDMVRKEIFDQEYEKVK